MKYLELPEEASQRFTALLGDVNLPDQAINQGTIRNLTADQKTMILVTQPSLQEVLNAPDVTNLIATTRTRNDELNNRVVQLTTENNRLTQDPATARNALASVM
jgi:hypothetical protein